MKVNGKAEFLSSAQIQTDQPSTVCGLASQFGAHVQYLAVPDNSSGSERFCNLLVEAVKGVVAETVRLDNAPSGSALGIVLGHRTARGRIVARLVEAELRPGDGTSGNARIPAGNLATGTRLTSNSATQNRARNQKSRIMKSTRKLRP